jgi:glycolate oxidase
MIKQEHLDSLFQIVGKNNLLTSKEDLAAYSYDASVSWMHLPDVVALPENSKQVSGILKFANESKMPVTPRGGGTNMSGGSIPIKGGIVLSTARMNRIVEINKTNLNAIVEPGVILEDFNKALAKEGLFFPPDPQSAYGSSLGGVISENSGGPSCLKYGVTRQYILGLEVVLPDGSIAKLGGVTPKNRTGYEMAILFAGSEGTLGVITRISLRVLPAPKATKSLLAAFDDVTSGSDAISAIISNGILPCRIEFCNGPEWQRFMSTKLNFGINSLLLIQVDGLPETVEIEAKHVVDICREYKAFEIVLANSSAEEEAFWDLRRQAFALISQRFPVRISEDVCVPRDKMTEFIVKMKEISQKHKVFIGFGGHAGDGNFHPGVGIDVNDKDQQKRARDAIDELIDTAVSLGGVISGEHGVGLEKIRHLKKAMDPVAFELMKKIKNTIDPNHIMNPGKIWEDSTDGD